MLAVSEFNDLERLSQIRALWTTLWEKTRGAAFHQTFEWLEQYWRHFGAGKQLRVLLATAAGRPVGLLPLAIEPVQTPLGPLQVLGFPGGELGKYSGALGPHPTMTLLAVMRHLKRSRKDWDVLDLSGVDQAGVDGGRTRNAMRLTGLKPTSLPSELSQTVAFETTWYAYWAGRSQRLQSQYRSAEARLAASGPVEFARFRPGDGDPQQFGTRPGLIKDFQTVLWSSRTPVIGKFGRLFQDVHNAAVRAGCADLNLLYVNSRPVAAAYNSCWDGRLDCLALCQSGNVPREATTVLLGRMLRDSFDRGDESLRLSGREGESIEEWSTSTTQLYRLTHLPLTSLRARMLRLRGRVHVWLSGSDNGRPVPTATEQPRPQLVVVS